jgi:hypothetical protein
MAVEYFCTGEMARSWDMVQHYDSCVYSMLPPPFHEYLGVGQYSGNVQMPVPIAWLVYQLVTEATHYLNIDLHQENIHSSHTYAAYARLRY